jgi:hypothetical protein
MKLCLYMFTNLSEKNKLYTNTIHFIHKFHQYTFKTHSNDPIRFFNQFTIKFTGIPFLLESKFCRA